MPRFTEDNLQRIIINPFYAITVAPQLTEEHEPAMGEAEWVQANASLLREMGIERWLRQPLDLLEGKIATPEQPINPFWPSTSTRCSPPSIPRSSNEKCGSTSTLCTYATWGAEGLLMQMLDVPCGDIVTAGEVGFAPPGGPFGYGAPGKSEPQRQGKRDGKKTPHLGVWAWLLCQLFEPSERLGGNAGRTHRGERATSMPGAPSLLALD